MNPLFILQNAARKKTAKPAEVEIRNIFSAKANLDATLCFDCAINLLLDDGTAIVPPGLCRGSRGQGRCFQSICRRGGLCLMSCQCHCKSRISVNIIRLYNGPAIDAAFVTAFNDLPVGTASVTGFPCLKTFEGNWPLNARNEFKTHFSIDKLQQ